MMESPSVGRDVHYVSMGSPAAPDGSQKFPSKCRAAKITEVAAFPEDGLLPQAVSLVVFNPSGLFFDANVSYDDLGGAGTWHWPERV